VVLGILAVVAFIWMHLHMFQAESFHGLLHSLLRVDLFFLVLIFASPCTFVRQSTKAPAPSFERLPTPATANFTADESADRPGPRCRP